MALPEARSHLVAIAKIQGETRCAGLDDAAGGPTLWLMALACNIDAKGKAVRLRMGILFTLVGSVVALVWAVPGGGPVAWLVSGGLLASGAFAVFEARAGWCALRALGFKTPV